MNGKLKQFEKGTLGLTTFEDFKNDWLLKVPAERIKEIEQQSALKINEVLLSEFNRLSKDEIFINDEYQVNIDKSIIGWGGQAKIWHLSIKRKDKQPIHDWRDLQAIKNMLVGEEYEALELYPSSSRVVDTANQFHLWAIIEVCGGKCPKIPIGWTTGNIQDADQSILGSVQRPI